MQTAEIIDGLRGTLSRTTPPQYKRALQAAIERLKPVSVTEAGLRATGFVDVHHGVPLLERPAGVSWIVCDTEGVTFWLRTPRRPDIDLHITSMQQLREVIAAIEGDADAS